VYSVSGEVWGIIQQVVSEDRGLLGPENESGAETECVATTPEEVDARAEEVSLKALGYIGARCVKAKEGTIASYVRDDPTLSLHSLQFDL